MKSVDFITKRISELLIYVTAIGYVSWFQESVLVVVILYLTISAWTYGSAVLIRLQGSNSPLGLLFVTSIPIFLFFYMVSIDGHGDLSVQHHCHY